MANPMGILLLSALCVAAVTAQSSYQQRLAVRCKKAFSDDHDCRLAVVNKLKESAKTADCFKAQCPNNEVGGGGGAPLDVQENCIKEQLQKCIGLPHDVRSRAPPPVCDFAKLCLKARLSTGSGPNKAVFELEDELNRRCARKVHPVCESWMRKVDCTCTNRARQGCGLNVPPQHQQICSSVKL